MIPSLKTRVLYKPWLKIRVQQLQGEGTSTDEGQLQLTHPAQAAYLGEHSLQRKILAAHDQIIEATIWSTA
jgi:hypothetical protein